MDDTAPDYPQILAVAKEYARETNCWINPEVNASAVEARAKIFSKQNKNHRGEPNYTQDQIHWFVKGKLLKYNRPEKRELFRPEDTTN